MAVGESLGDRAGGHEGLGVGGVGEGQLIEGVAAAGGAVGVGCPGGMEGQQPEQAGGNQDGLGVVVLFEAID